MLSLRYAYDLIFHFLSSLCSNVTLSVRTSLIILFNPLPEETLPIPFCASFIYPFLKTYTGSLLFVLPVSVSPLDCQPHEGRDLYVFFFPRLCQEAWGISVPRPGIKPKPSALEASCLNHWTAKKIPLLSLSSLLYPWPLAWQLALIRYSKIFGEWITNSDTRGCKLFSLAQLFF